MDFYTTVCSMSNNFLMLYFTYNLLTVIFNWVLIRLSSLLKIIFDIKANISFWKVFFIWELENRDPLISLFSKKKKYVCTYLYLPPYRYIYTHTWFMVITWDTENRSNTLWSQFYSGKAECIIYHQFLEFTFLIF